MERHWDNHVVIPTSERDTVTEAFGKGTAERLIEPILVAPNHRGNRLHLLIERAIAGQGASPAEVRRRLGASRTPLIARGKFGAHRNAADCAQRFAQWLDTREAFAAHMAT